MSTDARPNTLFIRLQGPFQAWGLRARWTYRDTALEPTKSGVIGLLACCLGWGVAQDELIRALSRAFRFGVRVDRPGRLLRDYHTVFGGVRSAEGRIKITASTKEPETVVSERYYLCDAAFLAALQLKEDADLAPLSARTPTGLIDTCATALRSPAWPPYLGRRSCIPSVPLFAGTAYYASLNEALNPRQPTPLPNSDLDFDLLPRDDNTAPVRAVLERAPAERLGTRRPDEVESLRFRSYLPRFAQDVRLPVAAAGTDGAPPPPTTDFWESAL
jgi:CRISPR system Cascade subunit CasD